MKIRGCRYSLMVILTGMVCLVFLSGISFRRAQAASATITIEPSKKNVAVGDSFYVVITIEADEAIGDVEAYFTYDDRRMEFVTGGTVAAEENKLVHIKDTISAADTIKKYSIEFTALRKGTANVGLISPFHIMDEKGENEMSASSSKMSVTIWKESVPQEEEEIPEEEHVPITTQPPVMDKKGVRLKELSISPDLLSPEFRPGHYRYTTTVDSKTEELLLSYTPYREDSLVEVKGNEDFVTGRNEVKIKVTGADGYSRTYRITVTKDVATEEEEESPLPVLEKQQEEQKGTDIHSQVTKVYEEDEKQETITQLRLIIGILVAFCLFLIVVIISLLLRLKGYRGDGLDDL